MEGIKRIISIDCLRGLVIILMTLDHVREVFHLIPINDPIPEGDGVTLYVTRWITHLCAPVFVFLAGLSVYLQLELAHFTKSHIQWMLVKRGLFLILIEFIVISFFWNVGLDKHPYVFEAQVIWAIGCSMLFLALVLFLPFWLMVIVALAIVVGHNITDSFHSDSFFWNIFIKQHRFHLTSDLHLDYLEEYPLLPWFGIIVLGFIAGRWFFKREGTLVLNLKLIALLSVVALIGGIILRLTVQYGDPYVWHQAGSVAVTLMDFFNVEKYPPSLDFLLFTLPIGLLFLCVAEKFDTSVWVDVFRVYGQVPFFYYVAHLGLVVLFDRLTGFVISGHWQRFQTGSLLAVWLITLGLILLLYWPCRRFSSLKQHNKNQWPILNYL